MPPAAAIGRGGHSAARSSWRAAIAASKFEQD